MSNPNEPTKPTSADAVEPPVEAAPGARPAEAAGEAPVLTGDQPADQEQPVDRTERKSREALHKSAQAVFGQLHRELTAALYSESTLRETDDGTEDIPWDQQSFEQLRLAIAENMLGISYEVVAGKRRKKVAPQQSIEQWQEALDWATQITQTLVAATRQKISAAEARLAAKASDKSPADPSAYLNQVVKVPGAAGDRGGRIGNRVGGFHKSLERLRLRAVTDVVDWFRARVRQVENMETVITRRRTTKDTIPERIARLDTDADLQTALAKLDASLGVIAAAVAQEPQVAQDRDKQFFAGQLGRRLQWAKGSRDYLDRAQGRMQDVLTTNRQGKNRVEQAVDRVIDTIPDRADLLTSMAREYTIGLSPEEERDFFEAMHDLFDDVGGENDFKPGSTEWRARQSERWRTINTGMHLYETFQDGPTKRPRLVRIKEGQALVVKDDHTPQNVDELFARAKADAQILGELRKRLRKTFAIMGPQFVKAVKTGLKDMPGGQRLDAVDVLNGAISAAQRRAVAALGKETGFSAALAGRKVEDLKYKNEADRPLIEQVRTTVCADLQLGTPDALQPEAVTALFELPPSADEVADEHEAAAERELAEPVLRLMLDGKVDATVVEAAFPGRSVDDVQRQIRDELLQLREATRSAPLREALLDHFNTVLRGDGLASVDGLKEIVQQLTNIRVACESLARAFGKDWVRASGIVVPDQSDPNRLVVNMEIMIDALIGLSEGETFIEALKLYAEPVAQDQLLGKVDLNVRNRLDRLGLLPIDQLFFALRAVPRTADDTPIHPSTALKRLAKAIELGAPGKVGREALAHLKLGKIAEDDPEAFDFDLSAIKLVIQNNQFD